ncbi:MAG: SUMF1/EgtB/PvdO family nonheme iron enzyme [Muribaculaceae bacterium]|nr:SUMF1/EgtB/PvdO family nonheme iron enzyme [Muribaculaceae bacterium]
MRKLFVIIIGMMQSLLLSALPNDLPDIEMVAVDGGTFTMALDTNEAKHAYETPKHEVTLNAYQIGKYEVTQELWEAVMGNNPSIFKGSDLPVENVSWNDIQLFIKKLNKLSGKSVAVTMLIY